MNLSWNKELTSVVVKEKNVMSSFDKTFDEAYVSLKYDESEKELYRQLICN